MGEFLGVEYRPYGDDDTLGDLERRDPERASGLVVEHEAQLAVDARRAVCDAALVRLAAPADDRLRDALGAHERGRHRRRLAAAVAVDGGVGREQLDERVGVAFLPGRDEAARDLLALLARDFEATSPRFDVPARAGEDLTAVGGGLADD